MSPQVSLVLHEADSGRVLRRALENYAAFLESAACAAEAKADRKPNKLLRGEWGQDADAARAKRRGVEFRRRLALAQQLVAQLPDTGADLPAPMGD